MALNDPNNIYGSEAQIEFARKMAASLLKGEGGFKRLPADVATLPYAGLNYGGMNILNALQGAQYRDIAGSQESKLIDKATGIGGQKAATFGRGVPRKQAALPPNAGLPTPSAPIASDVSTIAPSPSTVPITGATPAPATVPSVGLDEPPAVPTSYDSIINDDFVNRLIQVESGGNPNAVSPSGRHRGYGQFSRDLERKYGINDRNRGDRATQIKAIKEHARENAASFERMYGRAPTPGELYMMHQQGASGGASLIANPNESAWKVLRSYTSSDTAAKQRIVQNIPKGHPLQRKHIDNITAKEFMDIYNNKFAGAPIGTAALPGQQDEAMAGAARGGIIAPELRGTLPEGPLPIPPQTGAIPPASTPITPMPTPRDVSGFSPNIPKTAALPPGMRPPISNIAPESAYHVPEFAKTPEPVIPKTLTDRVPQPPMLPAEVPTAPVVPQQAAKLPVPSPGMPGALINSPREAIDISGAKPGMAPNLDPAAIERANKLKEIQNRNNKIEDMLKNIPGVPPSQRTNLGGPDMSGRMNAGLGNVPPGDGTAAPSPAPGQQIAQAFERKPFTGGDISRGTDSVPGYSGPIPPAPYLESLDQLNARVRLAPAAERDKIIDEYQKRAKGEIYEVPGGTLHVTPRQGGGEPIVTFTQGGKDVPLGIGGMDLHMRQTFKDGKPAYQLILPGGAAGQTFGSLNDLYKEASKMVGQGEGIKGTETARAGRYVKIEEDIQNRSAGAAVNKQMLGIAKAMSNDPSFYSGTGANKVLNFTKIASYLTNNPNWSGSAEAFSKILAGANIAGLEAFKGYGQIRNPEIELLREASGNIENSPGAIQAIIDMNTKASDRLIEIGQKMRDYRAKHGQLDIGFDDEMARYYKEKPLYTDLEIKNYRNMFKSTKQKEESGGNTWNPTTKKFE